MTKTNLWTTNNGNKVPVELMEDKHLKGAYRFCWLTIYFYEVQESPSLNYKGKDIPSMALSYGLSPDIEICKKFSTIFEEEIKRRGKKWKRPVKDNLYSYLKQRLESREYLNSNFNRILNQ